MPKKPKTNEEIIASLKANPAYSHIDIDLEINKADAWCLVNNRTNTPRFFVNWLNRIDPPLRPVARQQLAKDVAAEPVKPCAVCGKEICFSLHREAE